MRNVLLIVAMIFAVVATGATLWGAYKTNKAILAACQFIQPEITSMKECKVLRKAQRDSALAELKTVIRAKTDTALANLDTTVTNTKAVMSRVGSTMVRIEELVKAATDSNDQ